MAASLKLTYSQIGFISTGNFVGYLEGWRVNWLIPAVCVLIIAGAGYFFFRKRPDEMGSRLSEVRRLDKSSPCPTSLRQARLDVPGDFDHILDTGARISKASFFENENETNDPC